MSQVTMSILGLYRKDPTLFQNFHLPTDTLINNDTIVNNLLMECAEFEILYPDPDFMKFAIDNWSALQLPVWTKLLATLKYDYDPISNYDRHESWTDNTTKSTDSNIQQSGDNTTTKSTDGNIQHTGDNTTTEAIDTTTSGSESGTNTAIETPGDITTHKAQGYDVAGLVTQSQDERSGTNNVSGTNQITKSETIDNDKSVREVIDNTDVIDTTENIREVIDNTNTIDSTETTAYTRSGRAYGNIGVTTTQQMIEQERNIVQFNLSERIINDFKDRFCICIY